MANGKIQMAWVGSHYGNTLLTWLTFAPALGCTSLWLRSWSLLFWSFWRCRSLFGLGFRLCFGGSPPSHRFCLWQRDGPCPRFQCQRRLGPQSRDQSITENIIYSPKNGRHQKIACTKSTHCSGYIYISQAPTASWLACRDHVMHPHSLFDMKNNNQNWVALWIQVPSKNILWEKYGPMY